MQTWMDTKTLEYQKKAKHRAAVAKYSRKWSQDDEDAHTEWAVS